MLFGVLAVMWVMVLVEAVAWWCLMLPVAVGRVDVPWMPVAVPLLVVQLVDV